MNNYTDSDQLKDITTKAIETVGDNDYILNLNLKFKFKKETLNNAHFPQYEELAKKFQNPTKPEDLALNHGEFITKEGVSHVIKELKHKKASNRAIISLISQKEILQSADKPIPSFLVLQFTKENDILYITTYFKALEVSKFLKINLEEIRLIIKTITHDIQEINYICLNLHAFRAYAKDNINPFIRIRFHTLSSVSLYNKIKNSPVELIEYLEEAEELSSTTYIETTGFERLLKIFDENLKDELAIPEPLQSCLFRNYTKKCMTCLSELKNLREKASHSDEITKAENEYLLNLKKVICEVKKCLTP